MSAQDSAKSVKILEKLKSAILNMDWEISDQNIGILNQELSALRSAWQGQKVHMIYLQILGALSQYIASTKEQGNPGAFPMLRTVFESLEDMVVNPTDVELQTKKVMKHVDAYNDLKKRVSTSKTMPVPAAPAPAPAPELKPKVAVGKKDAWSGKEQPSTINRLLNDKEDHTTDTIFDSMLEEMVQVEPAPQVPPARPPVQSAYNKDDGTEVEADRNITESFAEADALLDNFFEDDVPPPRAATKKALYEFDLGSIEEGEVLDLDHAGQMDKAVGGPEDDLGLSLEDEGPADKESFGLDHVEDGDLDIFKVDEEPAAAPKSKTEPEASDFPEMESALDDFFAGDREATPPLMVSESLEERGVGQDIGEAEFALDDLSVEKPEAVAAAGLTFAEPLELERAAETPVAEAAHIPASVPTVTVAGLKTLLLSVEWEVDDQLLDRVDAEISALIKKLAGNDVALIHLNFLSAVIHHIGKEQSQVISESMACLKMVTESLENLLAGGAGDESLYAARAVSSFIDWHELVVAEFEKRLDAVKKRGGDLAESIKGLELVSTQGETTETQKLKEEILAEVREILSREMQTIRRELSVKD